MELRRKEYLVFPNGRKICLTYDFDVLMRFCEFTGMDPKSLGSISFSPKAFIILGYVCAIAGEECEGRVLNMNALEFKQLLIKSGSSMLKQLLKAFIILSSEELDLMVVKNKIESQQLN